MDNNCGDQSPHPAHAGSDGQACYGTPGQNWCRTINRHGAHPWAWSLTCPGSGDFPLALSQPAKPLVDYWTVGRGARPLDPELELAEIDGELARLRGRLSRAHEAGDDRSDICEGIDALMATRREVVEAVRERRAPQPKTSRPRRVTWSLCFHASAGTAAWLPQAFHSGPFPWSKWLVAWAVAELLGYLFLVAGPRLVRTFQASSLPPEPKPGPDYSHLSNNEKEWLAYQLAIAAGVEVDGLWIPRVGDRVLYWNGADDQSWGSWREARIEAINIADGAAPHYGLVNKNGSYHESVVHKRIDQMKEAK
jgi:hypothetical protein